MPASGYDIIIAIATAVGALLALALLVVGGLCWLGGGRSRRAPKR